MKAKTAKSKNLKMPNKIELSIGIIALILIALGLGLTFGLSDESNVGSISASASASASASGSAKAPTTTCKQPGPTPMPGRCKWHSSGGGACNGIAKSLCNSQITDKDCYAQGEYLNRKTSGDGNQCTCCWSEGWEEGIDLYNEETPSYCPDISSVDRKVCRPLKGQDFIDPGNCINCNTNDLYNQFPPWWMVSVR